MEPAGASSHAKQRESGACCDRIWHSYLQGRRHHDAPWRRSVGTETVWCEGALGGGRGSLTIVGGTGRRSIGTSVARLAALRFQRGCARRGYRPQCRPESLGSVQAHACADRRRPARVRGAKTPRDSQGAPVGDKPYPCCSRRGGAILQPVLSFAMVCQTDRRVASGLPQVKHRGWQHVTTKCRRIGVSVA